MIVEMANTVRVWNYNPNRGLISEQEIRDLVDVLFRGDRSFHIHGVMHESRAKPRPNGRKTLGLHMFDVMTGEHDIYLDPSGIIETFEQGRPTGGNRIAPTPEMAMGMVLAHELQHANQTIVHSSHPAAFYGHKRSRYRTRACEREARMFADDSVPLIAGVLGVEILKEQLVEVPPDELEFIADCLAETDEIVTADIVEELRHSGLNNAVNVSRIKVLLEDRGVLLS